MRPFFAQKYPDIKNDTLNFTLRRDNRSTSAAFLEIFIFEKTMEVSVTLFAVIDLNTPQLGENTEMKFDAFIDLLQMLRVSSPSKQENLPLGLISRFEVDSKAEESSVTLMNSRGESYFDLVKSELNSTKIVFAPGRPWAYSIPLDQLIAYLHGLRNELFVWQWNVRDEYWEIPAELSKSYFRKLDPYGAK